MWVLTSMGRPDRIRKLVDSYQWGGESQVYLTLYDQDPLIDRYLDQKWPDSWLIELVDMKGNGPSYNEMFRRFPYEECYGFLADDTTLETPGMLRELEQIAGDWAVAYPNDAVWPNGEIATMPCIGGWLARTCGWLSPPNLIHMGIDSVWTEIGRKLGELHYRPELKYIHHHPTVGRAPVDQTYINAQLTSFGHQDVLRAFMMGRGMQEVVRNVESKRHGG